MNDQHSNSSRSRTKNILIVLLAIAGVYLFVDHGRHILPYLPFTFLLGCLFMHLFMHGSHGGHNHGSGSDQNHSEHNNQNK